MQAEILYLECKLIKEKDLLQKCREYFENRKVNTKIFVALPYILRQKDYGKIKTMFSELEKTDGVLVRNMETYQYLLKMNFSKEIVTDAGLYVFNKPTLSFWAEKTAGCCLPYELNKKELRKLLEGVNASATEQVAFGRIPLMVTANCVAKTAGSCMPGKGRQIITLKDRYHKEFPVLTECEYCYNLIYNTVPISLHEKIQNTDYTGAWRLAFTVEDEKETAEILRFFEDVQRKAAERPPYAEYTQGHEKRGVE